MAKFRVTKAEARADGKVALDVWVMYPQDDGDGGTIDVDLEHFTVVISAEDVLALKAIARPQRVAGYKALFAADTRIVGITASEDAVAQMKADVDFPTQPIEI